MYIPMIAYTQQDAQKIARHFDVPVRWMLRERSLVADYPLMGGVYYIRDRKTPEDQLITPEQARQKWPRAYVQLEYTDADYFIELMKPVMLRKKVQAKHIARRWMARYPELTYDLTETDYSVTLSVVLGINHRGGIPLTNYFMARKRLKEYSFTTTWHFIFDWALPNLHVRVFGDENHGYYAHAWVRRNGRGGEAVNWQANFPLTEEHWDALHTLDKKAAQARQPDWFFCAQCSTAKPWSEFGYSYFAERRCKDCVTPEWLRRAKAETYN